VKAGTIHSKIARFGDATPDRFVRHNGGGMTIQAALLFCAAGLALALLGAPALESATTYLIAARQDRQEGIDQTTTGSVPASGRYTIRKSVLWSSPQVVCETKGSPVCPPNSR
jgi:hypothetical protein